MRRTPRRAALAQLWTVAAAGCAQTDLVATYLDEPCTGTTCAPAGECAARACPPLESQQALCRSAAPAVQAGDGCAESAQVSRFALCSCSDLVAPALLQADAYAGTPAQPVAGGATLGINGSVQLGQGGRIDGSLIASGQVSGAEPLELTGELTARAPAPCACDDDRLLDIAGLVRSAQDDNDNAAFGLDARALDGFTGDQELELPCGRYFLPRLAGAGALSIRARGNVALFVEGNVELDQAFALQPEPGARLSVFVAGDMRVGGAFTLGGDPSGAERSALYLASRGSLNLRGTTRVVGALYAPRAELVSEGNVEIYGSLFVRRAALEGDLVLHQDVQAGEPTACGE